MKQRFSAAIFSSLFVFIVLVPGVGAADCVLPAVWDEVKLIHKDCDLVEVESYTKLQDTFNPRGANGSFDYCNTLVWREYTTSQGPLYTYEKIRSQHFPNSEIGEYRAPSLLYEEITNSKSCVPSEGVWQEGSALLSDNDLSSQIFPSRNFTHRDGEPKYFASFFNRHFQDYGWGVVVTRSESTSNNPTEESKTPENQLVYIVMIVALLAFALGYLFRK